MSNEKICKGCGRLSSQPLGLNEDGELYLACCPESNYVEVKKQSSVEWLFEQVWINPVSKLPEILEQAKAMHREEVETAYGIGYRGEHTSEEYYNETFKP